MKILSLFDGISCARVALERARLKVETYYASEIDKYAIEVSKKNWPDIEQLGSVKEIRVRSSEHESLHSSVIERGTKIDLLIGGSPCQDLSIAKKNRKGLDGNRSSLFWEYVRILREVRPKYFILENVNSMPKEAKEIITKELGVEPIMIDAALVSAQRRKRLFWTNIPNVKLPEDRNIFLKDILEDGLVDREKSHCIDANYHKGASWEQYQKNGRRQLVVVNPKMMNWKGDTEKSMTLTSSMYKEPPMVGTRDSIYQYRRTYWRETKGGKVPTLTANMGTGGNNVPYIKVKEATKKGFAIAHVGDSVDLSFPNSKTRRGRVGNKAKNLMTTQNIGVFDGAGVRKITPIECERLQSLPDNYTEGVSNTQRYKCLGNAFNVDVVAHILSFIPRK